MSRVIEALNEIPLAGLMLVVALGFTLGRLTWRGLALGPAGGTLAVALLLGWGGLSFRDLYGTDDPRLTVGAFGFALFIYSVGFEAGPRFFTSVRGGLGWRFVTVGVAVNVVALAVAVLGGRLLGLGESVTAGVLSGALTSAPTYAAASEVCPDGPALAVAFALTFPFGLLGVVLLIGFLPRWMGDDLAAGTSAQEEEVQRKLDPEMDRAFEVRNAEVAGKTLAELDLNHRTGCFLTRLHRGPEVSIPDAGTRLEIGDHVMARGRVDELRALERLLGPEVYDHDLRSRLASPRAIHVTRSAVVGKTLQELQLVARHRSLVTGVARAGVVLEPSADLVLHRDDVVHVSGGRDDVRAVAEELGRFERSTHETDIAVYAGGILLGLLIGRLRFEPFGVPLQIGTAAGLLLTGVLLGRFRQIGPFSAHVPVAARQLVRDLGILLFVAETGVRAGGGSMEGLHGLFWPTLAVGALATLLPVLGALVLGRSLLRLRPVDAWGSVCGGMTSSSALVAIRRAADSNEPAISYAASYAVASVLATLAGQLVVLLV